jgi:anti-sigma regulatory factor (Ser/Thr protein kinase)
MARSAAHLTNDAPEHSVEVSKATTADHVLAIVGALDSIAAQHASASVSLHLDKLTGQEPNRVSPKWGSVLTNILLRRLDGLGSVVLELPSNQSAQRQVARSGLLFALARHPGLDVPRVTPQLRNALSKWTQDWTPTDFEQTLFRIPGEHEEDYPQDLGSDLVAFLNPSLSPVSSSADDLDSVVYPWLRSLFSKARIHDAETRRQILRDVSFATNELLSNVRDHAAIGDTGNCSLSLFATGASELDSRIYVSVLDDGVGMPNTLQKRSALEMTDCDLVSMAFAGRLPRRHRGRGEGLSVVQMIADKYRGSVFAATGPASSGGAIIYEYESLGKNEPQCNQIESLDMHGTVVVLCLPTHRIVPRS